MLVGISKPDLGKIEINKNNPADVKTRQQIGFMPEDPYFYDHLSGLELIKFCYDLSASSPTRSGIQNDSIDSRFRGNDNNRTRINKKKTINKDNSNIFDKILSDVGLIKAKNQKIMEYSKGMKQRLGLAQAIVHNPQYIFLDEPLDGLDPIGRLEVKQIIKDLKKEGKTIFFNSHILADVEEICDQIGIINQGKLIYQGNIKKFCGKKTLEEAFVINIKK